MNQEKLLHLRNAMAAGNLLVFQLITSTLLMEDGATLPAGDGQGMLKLKLKILTITLTPAG